MATARASDVLLNIADQFQDVDQILKATGAKPRGELKLGAAYVAPRTAAETLLSNIWADVLGIDQVGVNDNFFELGGDSVLNIQMVTRARRERLGIDPHLVFEEPTIARLAARSKAIEQPDERDNLGIDDLKEASALGPLQHGMLVDSLMKTGNGLYINVHAWSLSQLEPAALIRAWELAVTRHDALRASFSWGDVGRPAQVFHDTTSLQAAVEDLSGLPETAQQEAVSRYVRGDIEKGFDLGSAPLMRLAIFKLARSFHLVWTYHHIICDGWSASLILRDVSLYYLQLCSGKEPQVEQGPSFRDYLRWLERQDLSGAYEYWRNYLRDPPKQVGLLPAGPSRPSGLAYGNATWRVWRRLPEQRSKAIDALAKQYHVTGNTIMQGAWSIILSRYGASDDVVFGTATSGRGAGFAKADQLVGNCINSLPVRVHVAPEATPQAWLARLQREQAELRRFEFVPLHKIRGWVGVSPGLPVFGTLQVMESFPEAGHLQPFGKVNLGDSLSWEWNGVPLTFVVWPGETYRLELRFDSSQYDVVSAQRILEQLETVLDNFAANRSVRIGELSPLNDFEEAHLVFEKDTSPALSQGASLVELFDGRAEMHPDALAVVFEDHHLTYAACDARANHVALDLHRRGAGSDVLVGLRVDRSESIVLGILGILKAGAAYVPIDPAYPAERQQIIMTDSQLTLVVGEGGDKLSNVGDEKIQFLDIASKTDLPGSSAAGELAPHDVAYVIYTSGSTGKPKGCLVTHQNVTRLFDATKPWFEFSERDIWSLFHSYGFDFSVWELWGALLYGGHVVVLPFGVTRAPDRLYQVLIETSVTVLSQTPSAFQQLARVRATADRTQAPGALRAVVFGGEALDLGALRSWSDVQGCARPELINMYGITETTVHVTYRRLLQEEINSETGKVIGVPIPDLECRVADRHARGLPLGVTGELQVGGAGVARGYLNRRSLTSERFVPGGAAATRFYRSGDVAHRARNGELVYDGRLDHQVKIRGFRIEIGEIEAVISAHTDVSENAVIVRNDEGHKRLVAFVVPGSNKEPDMNQVRAFVAQRLPDYMTPSLFVVVAVLPLTQHGKIDRDKLAKLPLELEGSGKSDEQPLSEMERALATIWKDILRAERVSRDDNFFASGGDSILAIEMVAAANRAGLAITVGQLFQHQTVAQLASVAVRSKVAQPRRSPARRSGEIPLTAIQRWWLDDAVDPYLNIHPLMFELDPGLALPLLGNALESLVSHHDALRLRFSRVAGTWHQTLAAKEHSQVFVEVDLSSLSLPEARSVQERHATHTYANLNLEAGPVTRFVGFRLDADRATLFLAIHHLAIDAVSWRVLLTDLRWTYDLLRRGESLVPPTGGDSFAGWALALKEHADSERARRQIAYWSEQTRAKRSTESTPLSDEGASSLARDFDASFTRTLVTDVPQLFPIRVEELLMAALLRSWHQVFGTAVMILEIEHNGREIQLDGVDVSRTVGWFTSVFPLKLACEDPGDASSLLKATKQALRSVPDDGQTFGCLRYLCSDNAVRDGLGSATRDLRFNYLGQTDQALDAAGLGRWVSWTPSIAKTAARMNPTPLFELIIKEQQLHASWAFPKSWQERAQALDAAFSRALTDLVAYCKNANADTGYVPSDLTDTNISQGDLDEILKQIG